MIRMILDLYSQVSDLLYHSISVISVIVKLACIL